MHPVPQACPAERDQKEIKGQPATTACLGVRETRVITAHRATLSKAREVLKATRVLAETKDFPAGGVRPDRAESAAMMGVPDPRAGEDALALAKARDRQAFRAS